MPPEAEESQGGPAIQVVPFPDTVYRVARKHAATRYSRISPADDANPKAGHRWDVLGGGVLYVGSTARIAYMETLGIHRPSNRIKLEPASDDERFMSPGSVLRDWRESRALYEISAHRDGATLPFVNLIDPQTRTALQELLREFLQPAGIEHIDVPEVTSKNRVQTRLLARALYSMVNDDGDPMFGGICYESRYDSRETCWAVFDHFAVEVVRQSPVDNTDEVLRRAALDLGLTVH